MTIDLQQGDCLELMKAIPDKSADMVLCDLPYGVTKNDWDKIIPFEELWEGFNRVVKDNGAVVLNAQEPFTAKLIMSNIKNFKYKWVWCKHYAKGFLNAKKQPLRNCEDICVFYRKQCTYNPQMRKGRMREKGTGTYSSCYGNFHAVKAVNDMYYPTTLLDFKGVTLSSVLHPTQKPVELCEYLIKTYTNEGETVLDCCMGSGTTGVACVNTGRNFIGMELDGEYFKIAQERIEKAYGQGNLDAVR